MAFEPVFGYRLRFHIAAGNGDILINHVDTNGTTKTTPFNNLTADRFAAVATLLTTDKDHRVLFDAATSTLDAGPEKLQP
jgi:hypothetical protein